MPYYYPLNPPYVLLIAGLLAGIASGAAFSASLKQLAYEWSQDRSSETLATMRGPKVFVPFIGIILGIGAFLASGLQIFGFPPKLAYLFSLPLTAFTAILVWFQLGRILVQLERGGSKALDLDSFN